MSVARKKMTMTGHCILGQCEGTKPKSAYGNPMPTCMMWDWCKCKCHKQITEMYEISGLARECSQNPEYKPAPRTYWMPGDPDTLPQEPLSIPDGVITPANVEEPFTTPPNAPATPSYAPTPTGRKARGQLEYEVLLTCKDFVNKIFDWQYCLPKLVAEEIGKRNAAEPPSTGAINSVWNRWEKLGIAEQAKHPSRFVGFVEFDGSFEALDRIKLKQKREQRRGQAQLRRGIRPPQR